MFDLTHGLMFAIGSMTLIISILVIVLLLTNNNMTIVRNIAYSQINKINKKIKEEIEVDNTLLSMIDINMKNAINKIINNYKLKLQQ